MGDRNIILFSWSRLWSMKKGAGAPSFQKTIELYIKKGWNVYAIMADDSNGIVQMVDDDKLFVLPKKKTDALIGEPNWTKPFFLMKYIRYKIFAVKTANMILKECDKKALIYAYEIHGVPAAKIISEKHKLPLVTRFQGTVATYFDNSLFTRIKQFMHYTALKTQADLIIMTDDGTKGLETIRKLGNTTQNVKFWRNGVDILDYEPTENTIKECLGLNDHDIMFLTVSRLQQWKRVDRAINVFSEIHKKYQNSKLVIVGEGDEKANLEALTTRLCISDNVYFAGAVEHDSVYQYMEAADFFLSFYDMSNVGNPLLEAMTLGKCIITLDVGDTNKLIKNNYNGIIVSPEKISEVVSKISRLIDNNDLRKKMGENAAEFARKEFITWNKRMENEYLEIDKLYKNLIEIGGN